MFKMVVFPATGFTEMAFAAAKATYGSGDHVLKDITIEEPLALKDHQPVTMQLILSRDTDDFPRFS